MRCDNYRGVSLLSQCEQLMTSIILQEILKKTEAILSEAQKVSRQILASLINYSRFAVCITLILNSESICTFGMLIFRKLLTDQ